MNVKMKVSCKNGGEYLKPGAVIEVSDGEGKKLIRNGFADKVEEEVEPDESDTLTDEEFAELVEELTIIEGVNNEIAGALIDGGYQSVEAIADAEPKELADRVSGVGDKTAPRIIEAAIAVVNAGSEE